jgi:NADH:ubiquinone oxidoreductase subunit H
LNINMFLVSLVLIFIIFIRRCFPRIRYDIIIIFIWLCYLPFIIVYYSIVIRVF